MKVTLSYSILSIIKNGLNLILIPYNALICPALMILVANREMELDLFITKQIENAASLIQTSGKAFLVME